MNWLESHRCRRRGYISCYQTPPKSRLSLQIPLSKVQVPKKEVNSVKRRINIRIWIPNLANLSPPRPPELAAWSVTNGRQSPRTVSIFSFDFLDVTVANLGKFSNF